jgi:hypothetical protein
MDDVTRVIPPKKGCQEKKGFASVAELDDSEVEPPRTPPRPSAFVHINEDTGNTIWRSHQVKKMLKRTMFDRRGTLSRREAGRDDTIQFEVEKESNPDTHGLCNATTCHPHVIHRPH